MIETSAASGQVDSFRSAMLFPGCAGPAVVALAGLLVFQEEQLNLGAHQVVDELLLLDIGVDQVGQRSGEPFAVAIAAINNRLPGKSENAVLLLDLFQGGELVEYAEGQFPLILAQVQLTQPAL